MYLFIVDYGLHSLYLHAPSGTVAIQLYNVIKTFHKTCNHVGRHDITVVYQNLQCSKMQHIKNPLYLIFWIKILQYCWIEVIVYEVQYT
jgi:hypothetical protein